MNAKKNTNQHQLHIDHDSIIENLPKGCKHRSSQGIKGINLEQ